MKPSALNLVRLIQFGSFVMDSGKGGLVTVGEVIEAVRDGSVNGLISRSFGHLLRGNVEAAYMEGEEGRALAVALLSVLQPKGFEARRYGTANSGVAFWMCLLAEVIARQALTGEGEAAHAEGLKAETEATLPPSA